MENFIDFNEVVRNRNIRSTENLKEVCSRSITIIVNGLDLKNINRALKYQIVVTKKELAKDDITTDKVFYKYYLDTIREILNWVNKALVKINFDDSDMTLNSREYVFKIPSIYLQVLYNCLEDILENCERTNKKEYGSELKTTIKKLKPYFSQEYRKISKLKIN